MNKIHAIAREDNAAQKKRFSQLFQELKVSDQAEEMFDYVARYNRIVMSQGEHFASAEEAIEALEIILRDIENSLK